MSKGYNGWANYETWLVNVWIDNDFGSDYWHEVATELYEHDDPDKSRRLLADQMENEIGEHTPELKGLYADMLNAAFSEVDWDEIAGHYIDDVASTKPKEDDDGEEEEDEVQSGGGSTTDRNLGA